ncbi:MAG: transglycosylase domain-containing protein [Bacteroidetes bacterium]|nr:transglycosylase domain-containing protein [Bacteroidota bacterium]
MKKILIILWIAFAGALIFGVLFMYGISKGMLGKMPDIVELENPKSEIASEIYGEDGVLLGKYFYKNRSNVSYSQISPFMFQALIATEDIRFSKHAGIDFRSLARAIAGAGGSGGGSTITQQLAKNLFHDPDYSSKLKRIIQKLKEWIIAVELERAYTKDEIITMYLNTVQFSGHSYGIKSASKEFFNKEPIDLTVEESAVLVGLLKAITKFSPKSNLDNSIKRRNVVLFQMAKYKFIAQNEYDSLKALPITLNYIENSHNEGLAPYFREYLKKILIPWCKEKGIDIYKDGLKIYTTIDSRMQEHAERAVKFHLTTLQEDFYKNWGKRVPWRAENWAELKSFPKTEAKKTDRYRSLKEELNGDTTLIWKEMNKPVGMTLFTWKGEIDTVMSPLDSVKYYAQFLQTGFVAIDPHSGQIKAWVGGINHKYFQYDHVNKSATRQVGSTFKPLFYASALYLGANPCEYFPREQTTFFIDNGQTWSPKNSDGSSGGYMNMPEGLANSDNLYTAQLMKSLGESGPQNVVDFVRKMGIDSSKLEAVYSICLGVCDISVMEMASAFSVFANKGNWIEPTFLTRIEDKNGNVLAEFAPKKINQVLTEEKAYTIFKFLEGVVNFGTGARLRGRYKIEGTIGGKTGTTQSNSDGWFMGVTRDLVTATWVGCDSRAVRFRSTSLGQGANSALPIFANFIKAVIADKDLDYKLEPLDIPQVVSTPPLWECAPYQPNENLLPQLGF